MSESGRRGGLTRLRSKRLWLGLGVSLALAAVLWSAWVIFGSDGDDSSPTESYAVAAPSPTPIARPPLTLPDQALPARILIPSIGVDAPISVKEMGQDGVMQPPNGPEDVAWYDFSGQPGAGGNAVFSAHVDYHDYGPAVFAKLKDLEKGALVEVRLADGTTYRYQVVLSVSYPAVSAPFQEIVGATSREMVTLITCTGTFDAASRQYSHRLVVRAERAESG